MTLNRIFRLTPILLLSCGETVDVPNSTFGNETGSYETGYTLYDVGSGSLASGECVAGEKTGVYGQMYQCEGYYGARFEFIFDNSLVIIPIPASSITLGDEPYQFPKVMACCGPYNDNLDFGDQPIYAENCVLDGREQACGGLHVALSQRIAKQGPGAYRTALVEIRDYIDDNFSECIFSLGADEYPLTWIGDTLLFDDTWLIDHDWTQPDLADDAEFLLSMAVDGVYAPATPITCEDLKYNNTFLPYTEPDPLTNVTDVDLEEADGDLTGPLYNGARVTAADDFASMTTSCTTPLCSHASFSEESTGEWSIDTMVLFVDGTLTLSNGTDSEDIESARIELMGSASGTWSSTPVSYEVGAGEAVFLIVGETDGVHGNVVATNSTAITASELSGEWSLDSFEIEYVDDASNTWAVDISASTWLE